MMGNTQSNQWPPDYTAIFRERQRRFLLCQKNPVLQMGSRTYYKDKPIEFITDWGITYDPRNASEGLPTTMPFILFERQRDFIEFLLDCYTQGESGLVEKTRDFGATWTAAGFTIWLWLFKEGSSVGWGSRKEQLVDKIGDPDSIFEKLRLFLEYTPFWFKPKGFDIQKHCSYMKIINPENGATITGEAGDNIGRGGRKSIYFKDESAHYERPERIEASLGDNTNVQIDISSVNGTGNIFHRRRQSGTVWEKGRDIPKGHVRVFVMDWRQHPAKTEEWYESRRSKAEREGLLHIFRQEVDRDYTSAVEGIIIPGIYVRAAIDAHVKLQILGDWSDGKHFAGFDPYDEGMDAHAFVSRKGSTITHAESWHDGDTGQATRKVIGLCREHRVDELEYDAIGIGSGVKSETNRLNLSGDLPDGLKVVAWVASETVLNPDDPVIPGDRDSVKNKDFYRNIKAQAWWNLRIRFEKTYKAVVHGEVYDISEMISIPSTLPYLTELENELSQATYTYDGNGRIIVNKKPAGTKSPNMADGTVMAFWPIQKPVQVNRVVSGGPVGVANTRQMTPERVRA